jgi:S1-C subfamily serine protease
VLKRLALVALLLAIGFAAGLLLTNRVHTADDTLALDAPAPPAAALQPGAPGEAPHEAAAEALQPATRAAAPGGLPDFTAVAARTTAAVTNVSAVQLVRSPLVNDPFFRYFFGEDPDMMRGRRNQSAGSGVIVSPDGYVLTNHHVLGERVTEVTIILGDQREREAQLVGADPLTDLAVLKIDGRNLPTIPWGDSSQLRIAEWVLAIGNPYQLGQTVTLGIVSAVGRSFGRNEDFIQTDAAINPGNSGGALVNGRGELVGINTAIFTQTGGYQGIGFAVPSNLARTVLDEIVRYGEVRRGSIGSIQVVGITDQLASELRLRSKGGVLVWSIGRASEAFQSGVRPGDVIERVNGEPVTDPSQFWKILWDARIGSTAQLTIRRDGRTLDISVPVVRYDGARRRL